MQHGKAGDPIETTLRSATNRVTGTRIEGDHYPIDWRQADYWYENPALGLKIGFDVRGISETRRFEVQGHTRDWPFVTGVILVEGILRELIDAAVRISNEPRSKYAVIIVPVVCERPLSLSEEQKAGLTADCYALISKYFVEFYSPYYARPDDVEFHIYEAEETVFRTIPRLGADLGPDAITQFRAKLVV